MILLNMVLLLPLWLKRKEGDSDARKSISGKPTHLAGLALFYFIISSLLELRDQSFTNGLRTVVVEFLSLMLILIVL